MFNVLVPSHNTDLSWRAIGIGTNKSSHIRIHGEVWLSLGRWDNMAFSDELISHLFDVLDSRRTAGSRLKAVDDVVPWDWHRSLVALVQKEH
jgi:hypothetical protein